EVAHRVGQGADADDVDPGGGDRADGLEADSSRGLDEGAARYHLDTGAEVVEVEVVEHDRVDSPGQDGLDLVQPVDLDLEVRRVRQPGPRGADGLGDVGDEREVVVLRHHGVGQAEPVVVAAAAPHRVP